MGIKMSRRGWNNVIIVAVVIFIAVVQIPELMKARQESASAEPVPTVQSLLPESAVISRLVLPRYELALLNGRWAAEPEMATEPQSIVEHWQSMAGTVVDEQTVAKLKPQLGTPRTVEIWLQSFQEPIRVTVYQLPQFWLMSGWQGGWLAVTVEESYLFPPDIQ